MLASAVLDLPTGATVVCAFGLSLLVLGRGRCACGAACVGRGVAPVRAWLLLAASRSWLRLPAAAPPAASRWWWPRIYPLWEFARQVAGDRAEVVSLVPPGRRAARLGAVAAGREPGRSARLFVYNGAGLEPWAEKLLADLRRARAARGGRTRAAGSASSRVGGGDRSPRVARSRRSRAVAGARPSRAGLEQADPAGRAGLRGERAAPSSPGSTRSTSSFAAGLRDCARREVVTSHAAFAYLARRYRLTQVPVMGIAPEAEPSPAELAAIVETARRLKVTHIFFETLVSPRLAETLSREIGATPLPLNPDRGRDPGRGRRGHGLSGADAREPGESPHRARLPLAPLPSMRRICFVTCRTWPEISESDRLAQRALEAPRRHRGAARVERRPAPASTASTRSCCGRTGTTTSSRTPSSAGSLGSSGPARASGTRPRSSAGT